MTCAEISVTITKPGIKLESALLTKDKIEKLSSSSSAGVIYTTAETSFHYYVVERTRTAVKSTKIEDARAKPAKILFSFSNMQVCEVLVAVVVALV